MEKILSFLKKHKKKVSVIAVILVILIICFVALHKMLAYLNPDSKESVYGDRCELTESIMITDERKDTVEEAVKGYEKMELSTVDVKCNLIDIIVNVDTSVDVKKVKEMSDKIIEAFTKEELKYYDLELWINWTGEGSDEKAPMIGTKHKVINGESNSHFVW